MPAMIKKYQGRDQFVERRNNKAGRAWHALGTVVEGILEIGTAIEAAGLNWLCELESVYDGKGNNLDAFARRAYRSTDNLTLGVVGPRWTPLQNSEAFAWFQPFLDEGLCELETAGGLDHGRRVWILAKIKGDPIVVVNKDEVDRFLLLSNSHDGTMAVRVGYVPIRVVCQNTLSAAVSHKDSQLIRLRHTSQVVQNLELVRDIMAVADATFVASAEQFRLLAGKQINARDLRRYLRHVLLDNPDAEISTRQKNIFDKIEHLFVAGTGQDIKGVAGTYWGAYNAVTEYLCTIKGRTLESRYDSLWFGESFKVNQRALTVATEFVTAA